MTDVAKPVDVPVTKPVVAKQAGKKTEVSEVVVVETTSRDVNQPTHIDNAKEIFLAMVREGYGDAPVSDVTLTKVNHRIGIAAEYHFTGYLGG